MLCVVFFTVCRKTRLSQYFTTVLSDIVSCVCCLLYLVPLFADCHYIAYYCGSLPPPSAMVYTVAIVGGSGAVGKEIIPCLENRDILPVNRLRIFGSTRSAGRRVKTKFGVIEIEIFSVEAARECDVVFLAVSGDFSRENAKKICSGDGGAVVIDNSSAFRYEPEIPLVVPEINGQETKRGKLIANPNCTTAIGLMAIYPIVREYGVKRIIMSTYQAASGAGQPGMDELLQGTKKYLEGGDGEKLDNEVFSHPLPFNVIPHIDKVRQHMIWELSSTPSLLTCD